MASLFCLLYSGTVEARTSCTSALRGFLNPSFDSGLIRNYEAEYFLNTQGLSILRYKKGVPVFGLRGGHEDIAPVIIEHIERLPPNTRFQIRHTVSSVDGGVVIYVVDSQSGKIVLAGVPPGAEETSPQALSRAKSLVSF